MFRKKLEFTLTMMAWLFVPASLPVLHDQENSESKDGVRNHENVVAVGMSTALKGPSAYLGTHVKSGVEAAFRWHNEHCDRFRVELTVLDDGYEPDRTAPNMLTLIDSHGVVCVLGNAGAPCAVAAVPIANEKRVPLMGYVTGGAVLRRQPPDRYVMNYRASLAEEAAALVDIFIQEFNLKPEEIGFFTQRDTFGDSYFAGGLQALQKHGLKDISQIVHARYERNSHEVRTGLSEILLAETPIKAVAIAGSLEPTVEFIREANALHVNMRFGAVSFVDATDLAAQLGKTGDDVIVTQVVPHFDSDLPLAIEYREQLTKSDANAKPGFLSFEGYIVAKIFLTALERIEGEVTAASVTESLEQLQEFDIGLGTQLHLSEHEHQATHRVWPTVLRDGKVFPFRQAIANHEE